MLGRLICGLCNKPGDDEGTDEWKLIKKTDTLYFHQQCQEALANGFVYSASQNGWIKDSVVIPVNTEVLVPKEITFGPDRTITIKKRPTIVTPANG